MRGQLLELLIQLSIQRTVPIDHLRGPSGFEYVFCMLDSPLEGVRCWALQLLALMLDDSKCQKAFAKMAGFDVLSHLLRKHTLSAQTPTTLLQMALGTFKLEGQRAAASPGASAAHQGPNQQGPNQGPSLVHPHAVQVLLEVLAQSGDKQLECSSLELLLKFVDRDANAGCLVAHGALDWCRHYLARFPNPRAAAAALSTSLDATGSEPNGPLVNATGGGAAADSMDLKTLATLHAIIGRLFMHGLLNDVKALKVKELVDLEDFYVVVVNQLLEHSRSARDAHRLCNLGVLPSSAATAVLRCSLFPCARPLSSAHARGLAHALVHEGCLLPVGALLWSSHMVLSYSAIIR